MIRLDRGQRGALGETFRELANLIAAVLVLGQFVTPQPPSWRLMLTGITAWVAFVVLGVLLEGERQW